MTSSAPSTVYRAAHGVIDGAWVDAPWLLVDASGTILATGHAGDDLQGSPPSPPEPAATATTVTRDLGPVALLPGLVDAHSHAFQRAIRGATHRRGASDPSSFWSWREAMYRCAEGLTPEGLYEITRQAYAEMLAAGITCVGEFHYLHHQPGGRPYDDPNELSWQVLRAAADTGIRVVMLEVLYLRAGHGREPLPEQRRFCDADVDAYLRRVDDLRTRGVELGLAPHSIRAVPRPALEAVAGYGLSHGLPLHTHLGEQPRENHECHAEHGHSPAQVFADAGYCQRSRAFTAVHAVHTDAADHRLLAHQHVCACPTTEADLGDGIVPAVELREAGIELSLGSDSNAVIDLIQEARLLEMHERLRGQARLRLCDGLGSVGPVLLRMATEGGASSLGRADRSGRLAVGRPFDALTVGLDLPFFRGVAPRHVLDASMCAGTAAVVRHVFVGGIERSHAV
ncbi:formimidoylglutamate deiminase [Paraliomyxa miuraensis]|uniref:formimidoylglutamate deiminase n=1 Tax=Paraliomyxa miuraensis TaxID=376150 RepID=UPI002251D83E|nr:formimidoylglutamate deiminase [Paraliomyxa miuraensis]MCX4244359.1 formimidoylglutamate deiminase [Paraliomyxa miuraensis]